MDAEFWGGLLVGAALAVIGTFVARPLERVLDRAGGRAATMRAGEIRDASARERTETRDWLVVQLIEIAVIGAITGIGAGVLYTASTVLSYADPEHFEQNRWIQLALNVVASVISILGATLVLRLATTAVRTARLLWRGKIAK